MKKQRNEGVTLIALVVTIVVLLIIAGVAVTSISGNEGVIDKSSEAKKNYNIVEEREILNSIVAVVIGKSKRAKIDSSVATLLRKYCSKNIGTEGKDFKLTQESGYYVVEFLGSGNKYKISEDGNVSRYIQEEELLNTIVEEAKNENADSKVVYDSLEKYCTENIGTENVEYVLLTKDDYFIVKFLDSGTNYKITQDGTISKL